MTTHEHHNQTCATCGGPIAEPYAHCGICAADYCLSCGSAHLCTGTCLANGCIPGKCVKVMMDGKLSLSWGVPLPDQISR